MQLGGGEDAERVFLTVDRLGRHGRLRVGPAHLGGVAAQRGHGIDEQRTADDPDLQSLQVGRLLDRVLGIGDLAEAVLTPGQRHDVLGAEQLEQFLADFTLGQGVDRLVVRHQEGQREQVQLLHLRRPVDGRADGEVDAALAHSGEFLGLVAADQEEPG